MKNLILTGLVVGTLSVTAITNTIPNNLHDKRYNEVTFLMTHNATSLRHESTTLGDAMRIIASILPNSYPFIRTMTNTNKRAVVFANCANWKDLGIAYTNNITFGSNYSYKDPNAIYTDTDNPKIAHGQAGPAQLFIVDNYTTPLISGRVVHAQQVNRYDRVMARVVQYEKLASQPVTFVMVDFYNEPNGEAIKAVNDINKAHSGH